MNRRSLNIIYSEKEHVIKVEIIKGTSYDVIHL